MFELIAPYEIEFLDFIANNIVNPFLTPIFKLITHLGDAGIFWILLAAALLFFPKTRKTGATVAAALIFCLILGNLTLKPLIARIRPYDLVEGVKLLVPAESDYSFPSGHTLSSFAAAVALLLCHKKWGVAALVLASLIAISRLYFYLHYPSDVIAGVILGILLGFLARSFVNLAQKKLEALSAKKRSQNG